MSKLEDFASNFSSSVKTFISGIPADIKQDMSKLNATLNSWFTSVKADLEAAETDVAYGLEKTEQGFTVALDFVGQEGKKVLTLEHDVATNATTIATNAVEEVKTEAPQVVAQATQAVEAVVEPVAAQAVDAVETKVEDAVSSATGIQIKLPTVLSGTHFAIYVASLAEEVDEKEVQVSKLTTKDGKITFDYYPTNDAIDWAHVAFIRTVIHNPQGVAIASFVHGVTSDPSAQVGYALDSDANNTEILEITGLAFNVTSTTPWPLSATVS